MISSSTYRDTDKDLRLGYGGVFIKRYALIPNTDHTFLDWVFFTHKDRILKTINGGSNEGFRLLLSDTKAGLYTVFSIFDLVDKSISGFVFARMRTKPINRNAKWLSVEYGFLLNDGGLTDELLMDGLAQLEEAAKEQGCQSLRIVGRPGWSKRLKAFGLSVRDITMERNFDV